MPDDTKINWPRARPCHQFGEPHPNDFAGGITGCGRCGREENEHPEHRKYDPPFSTNPAHMRSLMERFGERFGGQRREVGEEVRALAERLGVDLESELTLEERVKWLETRIVTLKKELVDGDVASLKHVMRLEREIISGELPLPPQNKG